MFGLTQIQQPDVNVPNSPKDTVSAIRWSPTSNMFMATSWDKTASIWEVGMNGILPRLSTTGTAPILSCAWMPDGGAAVFGGCDKKVSLWNLSTQQVQVIGNTDEPVNFVGVLASKGLIISTSWDQTLRFWDTRSPNPVNALRYQGRITAADVAESKFAIATFDQADRFVY